MPAKRKAAAKDDATSAKAAKTSGKKPKPSSAGTTGPPCPSPAAKAAKTSAEYRERLVKQKKELYKDPPMMPPHPVSVYSERKPLPKRDSKTRHLVFADHKEFKPNLTPKEVLQAGSFGGTYFRPITSAVTGESYRNVHREFPVDWFEGLDIARQVTSPTYDEAVNKYKVRCGGSLGMWESSGWISEVDPYGWFQWYCRFYLGRRSSDDGRQIDRWLKGQGPTGRWRSQLCSKVAQSKGARFDDFSVSPVIRQTNLHWGYELTDADLRAWAKKKNVQLPPPK